MQLSLFEVQTPMKIFQKSVVLVSLCFLFCLLCSADLFAWNASITHRYVSRSAANASSLNSGVLANLGFTDLNSQLAGKTIEQWIQDGADFEDAGPALSGRFYNHFHDPLKEAPWVGAGLDDEEVLIPGILTLLFTGESALVWSQDFETNLDWSWLAVRQYYYQALIASTADEH
jgi:hypothetical protein